MPISNGLCCGKQDGGQPFRRKKVLNREQISRDRTQNGMLQRVDEVR